MQVASGLGLGAKTMIETEMKTMPIERARGVGSVPAPNP